MAGPSQRTHYQVLGVRPGASVDEVRRAHRQLAQVLHPDRQVGASAAERSLAERRMREVNMAWTVLSDPARRAEYDRSLAAARTGPTRTAAGAGAAAGPGAARPGPGSSRQPDAHEWSRTDELDPDEPELSPAHFWLLRRGPVVAALVVGVVVFVVTAYAGGGEGARRTASPPGCVRVLQDRSALRIACTEPNDGTVVTVVPAVPECPARTRYVLVGDPPEVTCVRTDVGPDGIPVTSTTAVPGTTVPAPSPGRAVVDGSDGG